MKTDLHFGHIKTHEEVKAVLTPEQRKKFNAMMTEKGGCMGCGMGMMHEHGGMGREHGMGMGRGMRHGCDMMDKPGPGTLPPAKKEDAPPPSAGQLQGQEIKFKK